MGNIRKTAAMSAKILTLEAGKVKLVAQRPPEGLFEPTGKILIEHEGEELLLGEEALEGHIAHGDETIDPARACGGGRR